jgi:ferrochelatase
VELARTGTGRVDVVCPGFVSDCLETLEEIGITAKAAFMAAGGRELRLLPCLNESPEWIAALARIAGRITDH